MNLLSPLWLGLAAAVAVPLLLHLRRQQLAKRVVFPAVRWLLRAEREHSRELKLRNLALMLLRVAAVLLVALAAAGPVGPGIAGGHAPTALAIVLDNSMSASLSMAGAPVLESLKAAARGLARDATADDRLWVVTADGVVQGGTPAQVMDAIARVQPLDGAGDLPAAVSRAATLVRTAGRAASRVAIATDGRATSWASLASAEGADVAVLVPASGARTANHAVLSARGTPPRWTPRGTLEVTVSGGDSLPVHVTLHGRTLARGTAGNGAPLRVAAAPSERGWLAGTADVAADELRGDDRRHFAVWVGAAPRVAVHASAGRFAQVAIEALLADGRVERGPSIAVTAADQVQALPAIIVAPTDGGRVSAANAALARVGVPWRFGAMPNGGTISKGEVRLANARVTRRFALTRAAASDASPSDTLATAGGGAWIVAGPRYVLVASPLDTAATDLALRAAFVPWVGEMLGARLAGDGGPVIEATPGQLVRVPAEADSLEGPNEMRTPILHRAMPAPVRAGVYFPVLRGVRRGALVVNSDVEESDVTGWNAATVGARVVGRQVRATSEVSRWQRDAFGTRTAASLIVPALMAALLVLGAEALLARHGASA